MDLTSTMSGYESRHYLFLTGEELPAFFKALSNYNEQHRYYELYLKKSAANSDTEIEVENYPTEKN